MLPSSSQVSSFVAGGSRRTIKAPARPSGSKKPFIRANGRPSCPPSKTRKRGTSVCCWRAWGPATSLRSELKKQENCFDLLLLASDHSFLPPSPTVQKRCAAFGLNCGEMSLTSCPILRSSWRGSPTRSKRPTRRRRKWRAPSRGWLTLAAGRIGDTIASMHVMLRLHRIMANQGVEFHFYFFESCTKVQLRCYFSHGTEWRCSSLLFFPRLC